MTITNNIMYSKVDNHKYKKYNPIYVDDKKEK